MPDPLHDLVSLGEVMIRFDPGERRISSARSFAVWEGGGEYNVARGLRRCFGRSAAVVTALADNAVGRLVEDLILQGGVDTRYLTWFPADPAGRTIRNGLNFVERGLGPRSGVSVSDRGHTAASAITVGTIDWDQIFGRGVRWFHTGGVFAALSDVAPAVVQEAIAAARRHGTRVSYDVNYRASLWTGRGGASAAREMNLLLASQADIVFGALGLRENPASSLPTPQLAAAELEAIAGVVPTGSTVVSTWRDSPSATLCSFTAIACNAQSGALIGPVFDRIQILDPVGCGDAVAAGVLYGLLEGRRLRDAVALGTAHGALVMTTPGDTSMATAAEVQHLLERQDVALVR